MADIVRSRKWMLTINNPAEHGFNHEYIRDAMKSFSGCLYWCMCDEVGDECETLHTHVYVDYSDRLDSVLFLLQYITGIKFGVEKSTQTAATLGRYIISNITSLDSEIQRLATSVINNLYGRIPAILSAVSNSTIV